MNIPPSQVLATGPYYNAFLVKLDPANLTSSFIVTRSNSYHISGGQLQFFNNQLYWQLSGSYSYGGIEVLDLACNYIRTAFNLSRRFSITSSGNLLVTTDDGSHYCLEPRVRLYDPSAQLLWEKDLTDGPCSYSYTYMISRQWWTDNIVHHYLDQQGNMWVAGLAGPKKGPSTIILDSLQGLTVNSQGNADALILRVDMNGEFLEGYTAGGEGFQVAREIAGVGNRIYIVGTTGISQADSVTQDNFVIGTDSIKSTAVGQQYPFIASFEFAPLGKSEKFINSDVFVSPNPAVSTVRVYLPEHITISELKMYNINGQLVKQQLVSNLEEIDITDHKSGVYLMNFSCNGEMDYKKLVKLDY